MIGSLLRRLAHLQRSRAGKPGREGGQGDGRVADAVAPEGESVESEALAGLAREAAARDKPFEAAVRWLECLASPTAASRFDWMAEAVALAASLVDLDQAERLLAAAAERFPGRIEPNAALAKVAAGRHRWRDAAERWDAIATRFAGAMTPADRIARATALMNSGRFEEADAICASLIAANPERSEAWRLRARIAAATLDEAETKTRWMDVHRAFPEATERIAEFRRLRAMWADDYSILAAPAHARGNADEAALQLKLLQAYQFSDEASGAARLYLEAFPDEIEVQLAALRALQGAATGPADLREAMRLSAAVRDRFAGSRAARVAQLQLAVRTRDARAAATAIDDFASRFRDSAELLPFRSWLAQTEGDFDGAKIFTDTFVGQRFVPALRNDLRIPARISPRAAPALRDKIIVLTHTRNEIGFVPWFLDYYRRLGADWFFVIDNASTDGTAAALLAQPDVTLHTSDDTFAMTNGGAVWINQMLDLYGAGNWCVVADLDEQLVMPELGERGLRPILDEMAENGEQVMAGFMLDAFPESIEAAAAFAPGGDPLAVSPFFDTDYFHSGHWQAPLSWTGGGARARLFGQRHNCMAKTPIVRGGEGVRYLWKHHVSPARASARSCALLHYKILQDIMRIRYDDGAARRHVTSNLMIGPRRQADRIGDVIAHLSPRDGLVGAASARYTDAAQLAGLAILPHQAITADRDVRRGPSREMRTGADDRVAGLVRRAMSATRRHQWPEAARLWREGLRQFDASHRPLWHARLGLAQLRLGDADAARLSLQTALEQGGALDMVVEGLTEAEISRLGLPVRPMS